MEDDMFNPLMKKKKKKKTLDEINQEMDVQSKDIEFVEEKKPKKTTFNLEDMNEALEETDIKGNEDVEVDKINQDGDNDMFDLSLKKKKKKKTPVTFSDTVTLNSPEEMNGHANEEGLVMDGSTWMASDKEYTYEELLTRVFDIMRDKNPDIVAGEKKRLVMKPPQVVRVGTKKTSFVNFHDICKLLHRQPKHLLAFLLSELGTSGSVDGGNQLIIKGKFQQKQIENLLRRYIKEYVTCHTCRSPDTLLQKDTRLFFLQCETCGSRCSVASIKSGFQAVTGKRAAIRAKTA